MVKGKRLIEKVWWVIPPMVVAVFITLRRAVWEMTYFNRPLCVFVSLYMKNTLALLYFHFFDFWGIIIMLLTITFMGIGYYLSRNKSIIIRVVVPIIAAIIGYYGSLVLIGALRFGSQ